MNNEWAGQEMAWLRQTVLSTLDEIERLQAENAALKAAPAVRVAESGDVVIPAKLLNEGDVRVWRYESTGVWQAQAGTVSRSGETAQSVLDALTGLLTVADGGG